MNPNALEINQFQNRHHQPTNGLSIFQYDEHGQSLFDLRKMQQDVTVKPDIVGGIEKLLFPPRLTWNIKIIQTTRTFATPRQTGLQSRRKRRFSRFLEMNGLLQVENYELLR